MMRRIGMISAGLMMAAVATSSPPSPPFISVDYRLNRHAEGVSIDLQASTNLLDENSWVPAASVDPISLGLDPLTADPRYRLEVGIETQTTEYLRLNISLHE